MNLSFIEFSPEAKCKSHYIQHISGELYNISVKKNETYNTLFEKIRNLFTEDCSNKAANAWVDLQFEKTEDKSVFETKFDSSCVAIFELLSD